ncbi:MAG: hypothetical protein GXD23_20980 [Comamonadaceae bacterium]|jgi:hypothetical protein|uniref:hypothetical protein n=1 Tax=Hydrogenophaga sp. SNF1 TaxID=3098762 RepID=UPI002ACC1490|nr:hypothetical protein [Hydrogenophaga sp. SNF1]NCT99853.1 hypothetical protein [Comamonadaceae bacterium]WQB82982.1 hypothetical protein SOM08_18595 [Hydrogenophaga sp. SNF1]
MNLERVHAAPALSARAPEAPVRPAPPEVGQRLRMRFDGHDGDGVLLSEDQGRRWRLADGAGWSRHLRLGDMLWMQVRATEPTLELEWVLRPPVPARADTAAQPEDVAAMRPDQAAQRLHQWRLPSAAELAAAWRAILSSRHMELGLRSLALMEGPARLPPAAPAGERVALRAAPEPVPHWVFHLYSLGSLAVALRVAARRPWAREEAPAAHPPQTEAGLELELGLPGGGQVLLQLCWRQSRLAMAVLPRQPEHLELLRVVLPDIVAAMGRAGAAPAMVQLGAPLTAVPASGMGYRPGPVSSALLQVGAEFTTALMQIWPVGMGPVASPPTPA